MLLDDVNQNVNEVTGRTKESTTTYDSSGQITKDFERLTVSSEQNVPTVSNTGGTTCSTNVKTPSKGSQSAKKKGSQSGKTNTPNQRFVSLRQYCTSPDSESRDSIKKDLFNDEKSARDKSEEEEEGNVTRRMDLISDKSLLRTGKVSFDKSKVNYQKYVNGAPKMNYRRVVSCTLEALISLYQFYCRLCILLKRNTLERVLVILE